MAALVLTACFTFQFASDSQALPRHSAYTFNKVIVIKLSYLFSCKKKKKNETWSIQQIVNQHICIFHHRPILEMESYSRSSVKLKQNI